MNRKQTFDIVNTIVAAIITLVVLVSAKNYVTFHHQLRLTHAIYGYQIECHREHRECFITQASKESYTDTFLRWWDWTDRNILPYDDYMRVLPYIGWKPD